MPNEREWRQVGLTNKNTAGQPQRSPAATAVTAHISVLPQRTLDVVLGQTISSAHQRPCPPGWAPRRDEAARDAARDCPPQDRREKDEGGRTERSAEGGYRLSTCSAHRIRAGELMGQVHGPTLQPALADRLVEEPILTDLRADAADHEDELEYPEDCERQRQTDGDRTAEP